MNIPFYRYYEYDDDGVGIYECLQCGKTIAVRCEYKPVYCCYCGIKYEGEKPGKGTDRDYVNSHPFGKIDWVLERRDQKEDGSWSHWQEFKKLRSWGDIKDIRKEVIEEMKEWREIWQDDNFGSSEIRPVIKNKINHTSILVRKKIYKKKTGKDFLLRDYNRGFEFNINKLGEYPSFLNFSRKINKEEKNG